MEGEENNKPGHLFNSEDLVQGAAKSRKAAKRRTLRRKENFGFASDNGLLPDSTFVSSLSRFTTPSTISNDASHFPPIKLTSPDIVNQTFSTSSYRTLISNIGIHSPVTSPDFVNPTLPTNSYRTPLSNITNKVRQSSIPNHKKDKGKSKLSGEDSGRLLFHNELDEEIQYENSTVYDDQIEESRIAGMSSDDDGIYSNDNADAYFTDQVMDDEFDTQYSSELDILPDLRPKQRRKRVIPDDYATLGGASVNCRHCGALMGNQRNPIFSICCRKGEESFSNYVWVRACE
ncbi:hypothetical protein AgCh_032271 [Apium graveolens]